MAATLITIPNTVILSYTVGTNKKIIPKAVYKLEITEKENTKDGKEYGFDSWRQNFT